MQGQKYIDKMCLIQTSSGKRTDKSGKLCVEELYFIVGKQLFGDLDAAGVVGLAPTDEPSSIINQLQKFNIIDNRIVGINYENPSDVQQDSKISFGKIDYN